MVNSAASLPFPIISGDYAYPPIAQLSDDWTLPSTDDAPTGRKAYVVYRTPLPERHNAITIISDTPI
jgi:hypothetical protein